MQPLALCLNYCLYLCKELITAGVFLSLKQLLVCDTVVELRLPVTLLLIDVNCLLSITASHHCETFREVPKSYLNLNSA